MDSPLKKRKVKEEWKTQRPVISKATVKRVCQCDYADTSTCWWLERWIDELVRSYSYPPHLKSDDFYSLLSYYFDGSTTIKILERVRLDYLKIHPLPIKEDMDWLPQVLEQDANSGY